MTNCSSCLYHIEKHVNIYYEGLMQVIKKTIKDDGKKKSSTLKWWVLDGVRGKLYPYTSSKKIFRNGRSITVVNVKVFISQNNLWNNPHVLEISSPQDVYSLILSNANELVEWQQALMRVSSGISSDIAKKIASRGILDGKYFFVRELGRGGSASVGLYTYHGKPYAIKKFLPSHNKSFPRNNPLISSITSTSLTTTSTTSVSSSLSNLKQNGVIKINKDKEMKLSDIKINISREILREIAIMKKVSEIPNVVSLYEVIYDEPTQQVYMVLEYLGGGPSVEWHEKSNCFTIPGQDNALDEDTARDYMRSIVTGLSCLHSNHLCHRDIKPANLLTSTDRKECKIADFGVAHIFEPDQEVEKLQDINDEANNHINNKDMGMLKNTKGTYEFMAPEMLTGDAYSGYIADIWALGITLYAFVFGKLPFHSKNTLDLFDLISNEEIKFPNDRGSESLKDLLKKMLEKDPMKRISFNQISKHKWMISGNLMEKKKYLQHYQRYSVRNLSTVTDEDISNAIYSLQSKFDVFKSSHNDNDNNNNNNNRNNEQCSSTALCPLNNLNDESMKMDENEKNNIGKKYLPQPINSSKFSIPDELQELIEIIASQCHFHWCHAKTLNGWIYGPMRENEKKNHPSLLPFHKLPKEIQQKNYLAVSETIKAVLGLNYKIYSSCNRKGLSQYDCFHIKEKNDLNHPSYHHHHPHIHSHHPSSHHFKNMLPLDLSNVALHGKLIVLAELLAENAHEVWAYEYIKKGWRYGSEWNEQNKTHPSLLPYVHEDPNEKTSNLNVAITTLKTLIYCGYHIEHEHEKHDEMKHRQSILF